MMDSTSLSISHTCAGFSNCICLSPPVRVFTICILYHVIIFLVYINPWILRWLSLYSCASWSTPYSKPLNFITWSIFIIFFFFYLLSFFYSMCLSLMYVLAEHSHHSFCSLFLSTCKLFPVHFHKSQTNMLNYLAANLESHLLVS